MLKHVLLPAISLFCDFFGMVSSRDPFNDLQRLGIKRSRMESPGWYFLACYIWAIGIFFGECELYILL